MYSDSNTTGSNLYVYDQRSGKSTMKTKSILTRVLDPFGYRKSGIAHGGLEQSLKMDVAKAWVGHARNDLQGRRL